MRLTAGLDSGPVAAGEADPAAPGDDFGTLAAGSPRSAGRLLGDGARPRGAGLLELTEQSEDGVTYAEKIEPAERCVDPGGDAVAEARRIRALTPHIGAWVTLPDGGRLGVREADR